ncbi:MAG: ATP-dependent protease ATPase subunit HslU [Firmicutes bacterium]|nr:ATP-dependent protease ATPase subunit HslU [Bacillota bacterium]MBQ6842090.1 ATP-dependent protease ATPase subunit HslU [Bacillota bacterium]MBR7113740.1 ATP-dependent protease ATPase subunit HslU [Bacillota bacterium]
MDNLTANLPEKLPARSELTPRQVVAELDKYIVGQQQAKRCVAVMLRNRWRRRQLDDALREDVQPKNIIMIGPTGCGKTEIARRLAKLVSAPFIKVEATKFTEVGYVGRDVESIIRDLTETAIRLVRTERMAEVEEQARRSAELRILDMLAPLPRNRFAGGHLDNLSDAEKNEAKRKDDEVRSRRVQLRDQLSNGYLDSQMIEIEVEEDNTPQGMGGMQEMGIDMSMVLGSIMPKKKVKRKVTIKEALRIMTEEEADKLIDEESVKQQALERTEQSGIVFLDEIDKIAGAASGGHNPDISRGGVQRDILPIVEGTTVVTKYGPVKTDHILFIAAGAFHVSKPSDLIPELQGRFPIRVELDNLSKDDLRRILQEPKNSLIHQYTELMRADGVQVNFTDDGIEAMAEYADRVNRNTENIGARRLHTILEKVLEDLLFDAPELVQGECVIDRAYVEQRLGGIAQDEDLSRFIL